MKQLTHHIHWVSEITKKQGYGEKSFLLEDCKRLCNTLNNQHPYITHFPVADEKGD